jgi:hypothetical protein
MINWIPYTVENAFEHNLQNRKNDFVYLDAHNLITFSKNVLTTHFAYKSQYTAILPQEA